MHYLTVLLGSLLSMLGIQESPGQTSVTRISGDEQLLSRTTVSSGVARFQCLQSDSGKCVYHVYRESCRSGQDKAVCERQALADFSLLVGRTRDMDGLPAGFGQQVLLRR
ncbi:hypothetical protein [Stenotrophomonas sp. SY1]|jgi:hypothetical protein|uniref:hypothetical protein n=1 Tax=Stenotrophomonas sp. SY1 TaxID=477235 RepID=UPI001E5BC375|nr:hypothetical protein [Stenotrophomonas sp. SY1]MCD9085740.1 hypothetical protein [Stenotrophomonas sp. SY1]